MLRLWPLLWAIYLPVLFVAFWRAPQRWTEWQFLVRFQLVVLAAFYGVSFLDRRYEPIVLLAGTLVATAVTARIFWRLRHRADEWRAAARAHSLVLRSPFATGRWRVAAGGADPAHNHHMAVSDQRFAYDFVREDAASFGSWIAAPVDGIVVHIEDGYRDAPADEPSRDRRDPAGNYISLEVADGYVILAHLQNGSFVVRTGDAVRTGDLLARCGNSGNSTGAHLHVHAQNQATVDVDVAEGIPIAFSIGGRTKLLAFGEMLGETTE